MQELLNITATLLVISALLLNFIFKKERLALALFTAGFAFYGIHAFLDQDFLIGIIWLFATSLAIFLSTTKKKKIS